MTTKKVGTTAVKAKKAPAKTVAKKSTPSKASTKNTKAKKAPVCVSGEECFWVTDGRVLSDLLELKDALASMSEDVFAYHVSKGRNDFADWIESALHDAELAAAFRRSKKPNTARDIVVSRLRIYSN